MEFWKALGADPAAGSRQDKPNVESHLMFVEPVLARYWREYAHYKHQRRIRTHHVTRLGRALTNGTFEVSEINFYDYGEGPKCINGAHRLNAIIDVNKGTWLTVTLHSGVTEAETREAYRRYDIGLVRSLAEILNSAEIGLELSLSNFAAQRINSAAALIFYRFDEGYWRRSPSEYRDYEGVLERIRAWAHEGREYTRAVLMSRGGLRRQLWTRALMAVALVTYRHQPERAPLFWEDVACNSGLERGEPQHTLVNYLADLTHQHGQINIPIRAAAAAWNAWFQERRLQQIKVADPEGPVRISGTPFADGTDRELGEDLGYPLAPLPPARAEAVAA